MRKLFRVGAIAGLLLAASAPATPPPPMPPAPPENRAMLATPEPRLTSTGDARVDAYRAQLLERGGSDWRAYLVRLLAGVRHDPRIIERFDRLAAIREPRDYIRFYLTDERIRRGRALYRTLSRKARPGDPPLEVRLALWGMFSDYGARPATYDALQALLSLGAYERGSAPWDFQLHHAASLVIDGTVPRSRLRAYETGRLGQPQLLADRFKESARDGNGDGRMDIWTNRADILASIPAGAWPQYPGVPIYVAVRPARFDRSDRRQARMAHSLDQPYNVPTGILRRWDGRPWTQAERNWSGTYIEPYGDKGPAFLLLMAGVPVNMLNPARPRYFNDTADMGFGLAAGLLADAIAGRPIPDLSKLN